VDDDYMDNQNADAIDGGAPEKIAKSTLVARIAVALLIVAHFVFLMCFFEPAISTPDANGYFAQARLIAETGRSYFTSESPLQYVGMHWLKAGERYYSRYPPGFPLILAVAFRVGGPLAALLVNPLLASLTLLALFLVCRLWVGEGWGLTAVVLMALNPVANSHALSADSHTATAFFLIWSLYLLARWERRPSPARAFPLGLMLGAIVTIRYPEALFLVAAGLFMLFVAGTDRKIWRSLIVALVGVLIPIGFLCVHNHIAFGAFWKTGYSLTNEQTGFGWQYFVRNAIPYLKNLQGEGVGPLFGLGLVGIGGMLARRDTWKRGFLMGALVLPVTLLYMAYYWAPTRRPEATMRFMVPVFFVFVIPAVWLLGRRAEKRSRIGVSGAVALVLLTGCWGISETIPRLRRLGATNAVLAKIEQTLAEHAPPGSTVIADRKIQQHLDFVGGWRLADERALIPRPRRGGMGRGGKRDENAPSPMQPEKIEEQMNKPVSAGNTLCATRFLT